MVSALAIPDVSTTFRKRFAHKVRSSSIASVWSWLEGKIVMRRLLAIPALACALSFAVAPRALADAPIQISGTYTVTGFELKSVTLVGANVNIAVDESGTLAGDIQGEWFWQPDGLSLGEDHVFLFGPSHGTFLCSPCTMVTRPEASRQSKGQARASPPRPLRSQLPTEDWPDCMAS
jgi:hypothetical protein